MEISRTIFWCLSNKNSSTLTWKESVELTQITVILNDSEASEEFFFLFFFLTVCPRYSVGEPGQGRKVDPHVDFPFNLGQMFWGGLVGGIVAKAKTVSTITWKVNFGCHPGRLTLQWRGEMSPRQTFFAMSGAPSSALAIRHKCVHWWRCQPPRWDSPSAARSKQQQLWVNRPGPGLTKLTYDPLLFHVRVCGLLRNRVVSLYAKACAPGCGCQLFMRLFPREM